MQFDWDIDPIALYAALLSSLIAIVQIFRWWLSGSKISVTIINPLEVRRFDRRLIEIIISNIGETPVVVREVVISCHNNKVRSAAQKARFYSGSGWDPAIKSVPHPSKPNTTISETNLITPGNELHQLLNPFESFNPTTDWLKATVYIRNAAKPFFGWAAPVKNGGSE